MQVELLYHTPDPERAIATAARLCYAPVGASELMETMPPERVRSVLSTIMGSGHFSTLEHASYTFAVDGVSRALTHQLVRHRIASFNQQSQRYVKFKNGISVVKPRAAFYIFPKMDVKKFNITDDEQFALDLLHEKKILITRGGGFNWAEPDHFRIVYLPRMEVLKESLEDLADFFDHYRQS